MLVLPSAAAIRRPAWSTAASVTAWCEISFAITVGAFLAAALRLVVAPSEATFLMTPLMAARIASFLAASLAAAAPIPSGPRNMNPSDATASTIATLMIHLVFSRSPPKPRHSSASDV